jgi:hypothetical protein
LMAKRRFPGVNFEIRLCARQSAIGSAANILCLLIGELLTAGCSINLRSVMRICL